MPPKFNIAEREKKLRGTPVEGKRIGPIPILPQVPISLANAPSFNLEEDKSKLQAISSYDKIKFITNAEDIEEKMPLFSIIGVNFSILNNKILEKLAVVDVSSKISRLDDTFVSCENKAISSRFANRGCTSSAEPLEGETSITSYTEMGVVENYLICPTCNKTNVDCPGHLGQITLNRAFIHPMFMEYAVWTLISVCNSCSKPLCSASYMEQVGINKLQGAARLKKLIEGAKNCRCENDKTTNCVPNPEYDLKNLKDSYKVKYYISKKNKDSPNIKEISEIEKILDNITDEDAALLGFSYGAHPRDMIMKSFAVIPPVARPFTVREGQKKEDHLTTAYDEIIRDNFKYARTKPDAKFTGFDTKKDEEGIEANCRRRYERDLHFHISHFIDNSDGKYCRSPTEKIKGIKQRIVKKEGLIRGNIMGKRVNFCGRSVAGPDSELKFGEVAIPESMAKVLTVPEVVHEKNLEFIRDLWDKRKINYIYLGYGETKNRRTRVNDKIFAEFQGQRVLPQIGDKVERHLMNGDIVLLNRQPTLYKYSLVGNKVKLVDRKTIGLHMAECKMRQADFDGDELNIHVIQALDARTEAYTFANVESVIQSALTPTSMISMVFNALSGAWMLTNQSSEVILTEEEMKYAYSLLINKDYLESLPKRLKKHKINPLSGRALFSALFPPDFYYYNENEVDDEKIKIIIQDGVLVSGQISANEIGKKGGTIQGSIWKWYGQNKASAFITDCTFINDWFANIYGLTVGYEDIVPDAETQNRILASIQNKVKETQTKIDLLGIDTPSMTLLERQDRENRIFKYVNASGIEAKNIGNNFLNKTNPLKIMMNSGAKGNPSDISRITSLIGQVVIQNQRPKKKLSQGTRCLPYFDFNSEDIVARGFVQDSFVTGMTPSDMYFMSESTREGVANTALTTADTGAMHHRLVKVMEDVKVDYDGSVRNARGTIYQFSYYDGYEVSELVASKSKSTGKVNSFINIQEAVNRINANYI